MNLRIDLKDRQYEIEIDSIVQIENTNHIKTNIFRASDNKVVGEIFLVGDLLLESSTLRLSTEYEGELLPIWESIVAAFRFQDLLLAKTIEYPGLIESPIVEFDQARTGDFQKRKGC